MKQFLRLALCVATMCLASQAFASDSVGRDATGSPHTVRTDTDGVQAQYDILPNRNANALFQDCIVDTSAVSMCDSSAVLDTHAYRVQALRIRCINIPVGGFVRFGIQIRGHQNGLGDSTSVFPWQMRGNPVITAAVDSLSFIQTVGQVNGAAASNEFVVTVFSMQSGTAGLKWGNASNVTIMLRDFIGEEWWSDYTSIRFCVLAKTATVNALSYSVSLVASPL